MRILPTWLREFVNIAADDRQLAEDLTSAGIAVESVQEANGAVVYEMDLTTNRVDAMNHYGVAREASAIYDVELKKSEPRLPGGTADPSTPARNGGAPPLRMTAEGPLDKGPAPVEMTAGPSTSATKTGSPPLGMTRDIFPIVIEDAQGCARYTARIIRNVKIGPSPEHIATRLELLGSRSINNIADATNYALNELGHPTHAFDLDLLEGGTIIVRHAREGEVLKTLDGVDRKLTTDDLVIADARKPVALAGVMGGFDTMITERTKNALIESAWFDPAIVRSMAKRHGMHTDASHRFERGADWGITPLACDRVAELILKSAGGELQGGLIDAVARRPERAPIVLRRSEVKRNLGIDIGESEIERILRRLGFEVTVSSGAQPESSQDRGPSTPLRSTRDDKSHKAGAALAWDDRSNKETAETITVQVPTWRLDVEREIDLLEELARIYGYNQFPNTLPPFVGAVVELPDETKNVIVRDTMLALGYDETISITFISEQEARTFGNSHPSRSVVDSPSENSHPSASSGQASTKGGLSGAPDVCGAREPLALANPLSEEAGYMRTSLLPGLLNMVAYNLNRGTGNVRLFEAGEIFEKIADRHDERRHLGFIATGDALAKSVHSAAQPYTFFHMKGDIEELLSAFQHQSLHFDAVVPSYFHPGRAARVVMNGQTVTHFGQLHPEQAAARKLRQEVYLAEVMLDRLYRHPLREPRYQHISKFPAIERDFSFVFGDAITFEQIKSAIAELRVTDLRSFVPAEIYRGEKVGAGKYSVLLHAEFQSSDHTLRDDEVAQWSSEIIAKLKSLGGVLRA
ncbi:MAG: phenylalanine--tRNA ligase subunit beta [Candidatus Korobacteraceae bacterium]